MICLLVINGEKYELPVLNTAEIAYNKYKGADFSIVLDTEPGEATNNVITAIEGMVLGVPSKKGISTEAVVPPTSLDSILTTDTQQSHRDVFKSPVVMKVPGVEYKEVDVLKITSESINLNTVADPFTTAFNNLLNLEQAAVEKYIRNKTREGTLQFVIRSSPVISFTDDTNAEFKLVSSVIVYEEQPKSAK